MTRVSCLIMKENCTCIGTSLTGTDVSGVMTVGNSIYHDVFFIAEDMQNAQAVFEVMKQQLRPGQSLLWVPVER